MCELKQVSYLIRADGAHTASANERRHKANFRGHWLARYALFGSHFAF